jgi:L-seryl-tRNA(Ser) seleniumtransferase
LATREQLFRKLPSVDELLRRPRLQPAFTRAGHALGREAVRQCLEELRAALGRNANAPAGIEAIEAAVERRIERLLAPSLRVVINATGVVLHTNLGRSPLSAAAVRAVAEAAGAYTNLELDLSTGRRGRRDIHAEAHLNALVGAERSLVVNNNAAAVFLVLNTFAAGAEAIVSRGELVEIGGSFRVPDIMARSGARLVEVGTTNRTRIADYAAAVTPQTRLIFRVHRSNFTMAGFVEQPALDELVALGRERGIAVAEDLGSGCLVDLAPAGIAREPLVSDSLRAGVDVVTYSGDKLLGGPQAGLLSGRREIVERLRANPLFRALRVDRLTYAALEATLLSYRRAAFDEIPALRMIFARNIRARAEAFAAGLPAALSARVIEGESVIGGGSTPGQGIRTALVALSPAGRSAEDFEAALRQAEPPVIARIDADAVVLDLRTVFPEQEAALRRTLQTA